MKLWHIARVDGENGYDRYYGFVVRAETKDDAWRLAVEETKAADAPYSFEKFDDFDAMPYARPFAITELLADGQAGVIIIDHLPG